MTIPTDYHAPKIGFISLGCPKAGSDTEKMLSQIKAEGYEIAKSLNWLLLIRAVLLIVR